MGDFNNKARVWRFYFPSKFRCQVSNNLLDHIASIITVWIDIIEDKLQPEDFVISMTNSTTSEGCAYKTNFSEFKYEDPEEAAVQIEVA